MIKLSKYISVILASSIKFMGGPLTGIALNLNWWEIVLCSVLGMMTTILIVIYGQKPLFQVLAKLNVGLSKKKFSKKNRFAVKVKSKLGLYGIAFLTPILFTPIIGGIIAMEFRFHPKHIIINMFLSACFWGILQTTVFHLIKNLV